MTLSFTNPSSLALYFSISDPNALPANTIVQIYQCLLAGFGDYTLDRRGDVGAWVREAAMISLVDLTFLLLEADPALVPDICVRDLMPRLAQQANEKIDRTRGLATRLFASVLLKRDPVVPGIPARDEVVKLFPADLDEKTFQWTVESATFPIFCKLIHLDDYRERVLLGLTVSVGGLTERLVKFSSASLFNEIKSLERDGLEKIAASIVSIFKSNQKNDRVTVPLFKFLDQMARGVLATGVLAPLWKTMAGTGEHSAAYPEELLSLEAYTGGAVSEGDTITAGNVDAVSALLDPIQLVQVSQLGRVS